MADSKISALTAVSSPATGDQFAVNQGGVSKRLTLAQIRDALETGGGVALVDLAAGVITSGTLVHERGGLEADVSAGDGFVEVKGGSTTVIKSKHDATTAPTANDDSGSGYAVGSRWIDVTNDKEYICLDATSTAAVWTETTQSGSSPALNDVSDVVITSVADNEVLAYDSGGNWINQTAVEAGLVDTGTAQTLTNKTLTTPTIGDFTNSGHNHQDTAGGAKLDHGAALNGLTDDDHSQYALLAGRSGGQTLQGDTASGGDLTLESTANATKGEVRSLDDLAIRGGNNLIFYDDDNSAGITLAIGAAVTSRTHTIPDTASDTFAMVAATQTLTGKTIDTANNTITVNEADVQDLQAYITGITGEPLGDLSNVVISSVADNEVLAYDSGGNWINQTAAEVGLVPDTRTITINGTTNEIDSSAGSQSLASDRTWTIGLSDDPIVPGNSRIRVPVGTDAQRPGSPSAGDLRFNTDGTTLEVYDGSGWDTIPTAGSSVQGSDTQVQYNDGGSFGGAAGLTYNDTSGLVTVTHQTDGASSQVLSLVGPNRGTPANNDEIYVSFTMEDSAANHEFARLTAVADEVTTTLEDGSIEIEVASGGSLTQVSEINASGIGAKNYREIYVDAGACVARTTNGAESATEEYATNDIMSDHFLFDGAGSTKEAVQFKLVMPDDWDRGTIKAKVFWDAASGASASDTVNWEVRGVAVSNDDAIDASWGTAQEINDTVIAVGDLHVSPASSAITIGGTPALADLVFIEVARDPANDDMAEDAKFLGCQIQYRTLVTPSASW